MPSRIVDVVYRKFEMKDPGINQKGILAILEGPAMEFEKVNENNRFYPRSLIENKILGDEDVKNLIKNRALLGEGCHPDDRFEIRYPYVAVLVEDLWIPEDKEELWGRFCILDTPNGRILKTLVDVGSAIGISARALGTSYETTEGYEMMNEEDYVFFTFDAVPDPGFTIARPSPVFESKEKVDFSETVKGYSLAEKEITRSLINDINPEFFSEELEIINESLKGSPMKMLEESQRKIASLEEELEREVSINKSREDIRVGRIPSSLVSKLLSVQGKYNEEVTKRRSLESKVSRLEKVLKRHVNEKRDLGKKLESLSKESTSKQEGLRRLQEKLRQENLKVAELGREIKTLEDKLLLESRKSKSSRIEALALITGMSEEVVGSYVSDFREPLFETANRLKRIADKNRGEVLEARQSVISGSDSEKYEMDRTVRLIRSQKSI